MLPDAERELPYDGAKEMLLVDNVESREFLTALIDAMYDAEYTDSVRIICFAAGCAPSADASSV